MEALVIERPSPATGELTWKLETSFAGLDSLRDEWDEAAMDLRAPVYMSYDWTRLWWQFYGKNRELRLFIFRAGGKLVGLVPIYVDAIRFPPLKLRVARVVGASVPPKVFDPPIAPEWAARIWRIILEQLFVGDACNLLSLGPVDTDYPALEPLLQTCRESAVVAAREKLPREVHTLYHLPANYEDYFDSLDSKERKVRRKKLRELEALSPTSSQVIREGNMVMEEFERFAGQHRTQWESEGRPGHFHAWPEALEYNRALVKTLGLLGRVRFFNLKAGTQVLTSQYAFAFGTRLFAELPARVCGPEWDKLSLGCTSQIKLIEAAISEGFQTMESGLGHYEYKIATGGKESPVTVLHVQRRGPVSRLKVAGFRGLQWLLRLLLQKVWYRKIMPRLPAGLRGGQSAFALRMDF